MSSNVTNVKPPNVNLLTVYVEAPITGDNEAAKTPDISKPFLKANLLLPKIGNVVQGNLSKLPPSSPTPDLEDPNEQKLPIPPTKFKWSLEHLTNSGSKRKISAQVNNTLTALLNREPTAKELFNFHLSRQPDQAIDENDREIPVRELINWKKMKDFQMAKYIDFTADVTEQELKMHLQKDITPTMHLNCLLGRKYSDLTTPYNPSQAYEWRIPMSWRINLDKNRNLLQPPTLQEVVAYCESTAPQLDHCNVLQEQQRGTMIDIDELRNYLWKHDSQPYAMMAVDYESRPTDDEAFNWIENRDLKRPITQDERDNHNWKEHVCRYLQIDAPFSLSDLRKCLPNATWQQHINCNNERPLSHKISYDDLKEYIEGPLTLAQVMNWFLERDLESELNMHTFPWKKMIKTIAGQAENENFILKKEDLTPYLSNKIIWQVLINCNNETNLTEKTTLEQLREYWKSCNNGNLPELEIEMAWLTNRPLEYTIQAKDFDPHPWKKHINLRLKRDPNTDVSKEELQTILKKEVTQQELENCNLGRPLSHRNPDIN